MKLPKIYGFIDNKYAPLLSYLFTLPTSDFHKFLRAIKNRTGLVGEFHGFDFDNDDMCVEFWDDSSGEELSVKISICNLLTILCPIIAFFENDIEALKEINSLVKEIEDSL